MKTVSKDLKNKTYIKEDYLCFLLHEVGNSSNKRLITEQELKKIGTNPYTICNRMAIQTLKHSVFTKICPFTSGMTLFINSTKTSKSLSKKLLLNNFNTLSLILLAVRFNDRIYSTFQFKNLISIDYTENKTLLYQFCLTNLKLYCLVSK